MDWPFAKENYYWELGSKEGKPHLIWKAVGRLYDVGYGEYVSLSQTNHSISRSLNQLTRPARVGVFTVRHGGSQVSVSKDAKCSGDGLLASWLAHTTYSGRTAFAFSSKERGRDHCIRRKKEKAEHLSIGGAGASSNFFSPQITSGYRIRDSVDR